jgi:hypothetical protein
MDERVYFKRAGQCTRCEEPFGGNRATAFMVRERVAWRVLGDRLALCQNERAPVCDACVTVREQAGATRAINCKGCGLPMLTPEWWRGVACSTRCARHAACGSRRHEPMLGFARARVGKRPTASAAAMLNC